MPPDNPFAGRRRAEPSCGTTACGIPGASASTGRPASCTSRTWDRETAKRLTCNRRPGGGENYGWNTMEGLACYPPGSSCNKSGLTLPVLDYSHGSGCSITGGYVYRGTASADDPRAPTSIPTTAQDSFAASSWRAGWSEQHSWPGADPPGNVTSFGEDCGGRGVHPDPSGWGLQDRRRAVAVAGRPLLPTSRGAPRFPGVGRTASAEILFGTSSWNYPGWKGLVYHQDYPKNGAAAKMLEEYVKFPLFRTIGIDSSFYAPPTPEQLQRYADRLPPGFRCVMKVWDRFTVHTLPRARYGPQGGEPNPDFLNADLFRSEVLDFYLDPFPRSHRPTRIRVPDHQPLGGMTGRGLRRPAGSVLERFTARRAATRSRSGIASS